MFILKRFTGHVIVNLALRSLQLIDALVIIGMYGVDLNNAQKADKYADGKWVRTTDPKTDALTSLPPELIRLTYIVKVLAIVTGTVGAVTALAYSLAYIWIKFKSLSKLFICDWLILVLFCTLSGIFGKMYLNEKVEMESGIQRMKTAVYFDIAGVILWLVTALYATIMFFFVRGKSSSRSGGRRWFGAGAPASDDNSQHSGFPETLRSHSVRSKI